MQLPTLCGIIDRRILVNYRVRPDVLVKLLPSPFRPQLVRGWGIAGICLIRLKQLRPKFVPRWCGLSSENAAYRFAVDWNDAAGKACSGVYVPQRETSSRLASSVGARLFPVHQTRAKFECDESDGRYSITISDGKGKTKLHFDATGSDELPADSVFESLAESSEFFRMGSCGYSPSGDSNCYSGIELVTPEWHVDSLQMRSLQSEFFDDVTRFPEGAIEFDHMLLMRGIEHEWRAVGRIAQTS